MTAHTLVFSALAGAGLIMAAPPQLPPHTTLRALPLPAPTPPEARVTLAVDDEGAVLVGIPGAPAATAPPPGAWLLADLAITTASAREALRKAHAKSLPPDAPAATLHRFASTAANAPAAVEVPRADRAANAAWLPGPGVENAVATLGGSDGWWLRTPSSIRPLLRGRVGLHFATGDHGPSALVPGPDGRLYGTVGDAGFELTTLSGQAIARSAEGCAFRIEADGTGFEIFHRGLCQPCGVAFNAQGDAFTIDRGAGRARLIQLVDGGDSGWRTGYRALTEWHRALGLDEAPPSAWDEEKLWEAAGRTGAAYVIPAAGHFDGAPCSLAAHPGTGLLETEAGRFLACDPRSAGGRGALLSLAITPDDAGMKLNDCRSLATGIAATDAAFAWDGTLVIAHPAQRRLEILDAGEHTYLRAAATEAAAHTRGDFSKLESAALTALLSHPDQRIRLRAQNALTRHPDALNLLGKSLAASAPLERLHAIWGLGTLARIGRGTPAPAAADDFVAMPDSSVRVAAGMALVAAMNHQDPEIRAQALKALGDGIDRFFKQPERFDPKNGGRPIQISADELPITTLLADPAPRVRYFAAIALGKLRVATQYSAVCDFLAAPENQTPMLRHAGAFALQHLCTQPLMLSGLGGHPSPATRLGAAIALRHTATADAAAYIYDPDPAVADESIRAVTDLDLPESRPLVANLLDEPAARAWSPFIGWRLVHNAYLAGGPQNAARLLKLCGRPGVPESVQARALALCARWTTPPSVNLVTGRPLTLPKRDPAEMKTALAAALPQLAALPEPLRAAAARLAASHQLSLPAAPK